MPPGVAQLKSARAGKRQIWDTGCSFSVARGPLRSPQDATDIGARHWLLLHVPQCDAAGQSSRVRPLGSGALVGGSEHKARLRQQRRNCRTRS